MKRSPFFKHLDNQHGLGLLVVLLILSAVLLLVLEGALIRFQGVSGDEQFASSENARQQIQQSLDIVFSSPLICQNVLRLSGSDFTLQNVLLRGDQVGTGIGNLKVDALKIQAGGVLGAGYLRGTFVANVIAQGSNAVGMRSPGSQVIYHPVSATNVDDCRLEVSPKDACEAYGYTWSEPNSRCLICEDLGGTWSTGVCSL